MMKQPKTEVEILKDELQRVQPLADHREQWITTLQVENKVLHKVLRECRAERDARQSDLITSSVAVSELGLRMKQIEDLANSVSL